MKITKRFKNRWSISVLVAGVLIFAAVMAPDLVHAQEDFCKNVQNSDQLQECVDANPIVKDIKTIINFLSIGVGIIIVGALIFGGIHYMVAGENPGEITKAKHRLTSGLIALVVYLLMFAFLQWLVPGGVFNTGP